MSNLKRIKTINVDHNKGSTSVVISKLDSNNFYGVVIYQVSHLNTPLRKLSTDIEYIHSNTAAGAESSAIEWIKENIANTTNIKEIDDEQKT